MWKSELNRKLSVKTIHVKNENSTFHEFHLHQCTNSLARAHTHTHTYAILAMASAKHYYERDLPARRCHRCYYVPMLRCSNYVLPYTAHQRIHTCAAHHIQDIEYILSIFHFLGQPARTSLIISHTHYFSARCAFVAFVVATSALWVYWSR